MDFFWSGDFGRKTRFVVDFWCPIGFLLIIVIDIRNDKPSTYAQSIVPNSLQRTLQQSRTEHEQKANDEQERICMEYAVNLSLIESQRRDGGASGSDIGEQLDLDNSEEESITDGADYRDEEDEDGEELEFDEYD